MLDRIRPRAVLVAALLAGLGSAAVGPAVPASAVVVGGPASSPAPGSASPVAQAVGGPQLAAKGVVVNYPSRSAPRLPGVAASAFVVADASTGRVLAAKDPHGWYRRSSAGL
jgi:D-alanyl-D-alanine carboxypeptidase (penicillin-binding protein 5/6)